MKRKFTFLIAAALMLLTMMATTGRMWGQSGDLYYTLTPGSTGGNSTPHNSYTAAATTTIDGIEWSVMGNSNMVPWRIGGKSTNTPADREVFSKTAMGSAINEVKLTVGNALNITVNSLNLIVASNADFSDQLDNVSVEFEANSTLSFTPTSPNTSWAAGAYYKFIFNVTVSVNSNKFVEFSEAKFYAPNSGTNPSITASNVDIAYDATNGSIAYTLNNATGNVTAAITTGDWLTLGTVTASEVPFTCSANTLNTTRTATVTLSFEGAEDKDVTVTQAAAPVVFTTIPGLFEAATATETDVLVTFNSWVVSGVSTNGKNIFVTDNNGNGFVIYYSDNMSGTYAAGNILSGTVSCKLKLYNGFAELLNVDADDLTITEGGTVTVAEVAMAGLTGVNTGALLHYDNLTCNINNNRYYLSDGTTSLQVYNALYAFGTTLVANHSYNITGVYQQFNSTKEILPRSAADIEEYIPSTPTIILSESSFDLGNNNAVGEEISRTFTVSQSSLTAGITISVDGNGSVNPVSINQGAEDTEVTWTYTPTAVGEIAATISVSSTGAETQTITITGTAINGITGDCYEMVTEAQTEWSGGYLLTGINSTTYYALTGVNNSNLGTTAVVTPVGNKIESNTTTDGYRVLVAATSNGYSLYMEGYGYLYYSGSSNNLYATTNFEDETCEWTIGIENGLVTFTNVGNNERTIRFNYNNGSPRFACYGTNTTMQKLTVYKYTGTVTLPPVINAENPEVLAYNATSGTIYYDIENYVAGTMTASTEATWISNFTYQQVDEIGEVGFTTTANNGAARQATVTLTYTYNTNETVTKNVTVSQAALPVPTITVDPATVNAPVAGETSTLALTYQDITITAANDFDIKYYNANNEPLSTDPDWLLVVVEAGQTSGYEVSYTIEENDGEARTAYFKVFALGDQDYVYSNLVTVNQAAYTQLATYSLVTSVDDIVSGKHYIIASSAVDGAAYAMGNQNGNNRKGYAVTVANEQITEAEGVYEFVINTNLNSNNEIVYTIYDAVTPGYLYASSSSANQLKTTTTLNDNGKWAIEISSTGAATITAQGSNSRKLMRYNPNNNSPIFACYATNATTGNAPCLYVKDNDNNLEYYGTEITYPGTSIPDGGSITVGNGSVMTVPAAFTNTDPTSLVIEDGGQLVVSNPVAATMDKIYTKTSSWGNNSKGVNGWYLISSPVGTVNTSAVANLTPANSYDLYAYNEPDMMWYNAQGADHPFSQLVEGEGYLYSSKDGADAAYSGTVFCGPLTKTLSYEAANAEMKGWNLLGNPYSHNITWANLTPTGVNESGYYTLGFDGSWSAEPSTTAVIKPMQGFLVQATSAGAKVVFNNIAASAKARSNNDFIAFTVANGQYEDVTYAMFEEGLGLNKINHRNSDIPMVYIPQNGQNYAIATMSDETQSFNLNFKAMTTGKYTLSYKAEGKYDYLHVIDRITGEDVDMLLDGEYSFMASAGDNDARFIVKLRYDANGNFDSDIFAYQNGNDVIVNGEGELQMFDLTGRMVANTMVNGVQTVNVPTQGVYIFRLVGNDVKTQKIVVR